MTALLAHPITPCRLKPFQPAGRRCAFTVSAQKGFGPTKKETRSREEASSAAPEAASVRPAESASAPPPPPAASTSAPQRSRPIRETPQVVVDRMFKRIVICSGLPVFGGMALYPLFYYLRVVQDIDYPLWIVYIAQLLSFGGGLAGITYGVLSSSWDPSREGSLLGWTELQANVGILMSNKDKK